MGPNSPNLDFTLGQMGYENLSISKGIVLAYEVALWTGVGSAGLIYWAEGAANIAGGFAGEVPEDHTYLKTILTKPERVYDADL